MTQQLQAMEGKERAEALKTAKDLVQRFGFQASELGLAVATRGPGKKGAAARVREERPAKYREPKTGATWNGWGKPPHWMPKDKAKREKYLIGAGVDEKRPETAVPAPGPASVATKKAAPGKKTVRQAAAKKGASKKTTKARAVKKAPAKKTGKSATAQPGDAGGAEEGSGS